MLYLFSELHIFPNIIYKELNTEKSAYPKGK